MSTAGVSGDPVTMAGNLRSHLAKPGPSNSLTDSDHLLVLVKPKTRTKAEREKAGREEAEMNAWASRGVARDTMLGGHGCTGTGCRKHRHDADRYAMGVLLAMLGLAAEPDVPGQRYGGYRQRHKTAPRGMDDG